VFGGDDPFANFSLSQQDRDMTRGKHSTGESPTPSDTHLRNQALSELLDTCRDQFGDLTENERAEAHATFHQLDEVIAGDRKTEAHRIEIVEEIMREDSHVLRRLAQ
jgi:hypothetical protein